MSYHATLVPPLWSGNWEHTLTHVDERMAAPPLWSGNWQHTLTHVDERMAAPQRPLPGEPVKVAAVTRQAKPEHLARRATLPLADPVLPNAIERSSYFIAGQVIATRVSGDPVSGNNGLFFLYTDHLGSTSVLVNHANNSPVSGSRTWYLPFGGYRGTTPTQAITDRDFTGQKENMELGLLYYNARYYLPGVGRFLSADTLVPSPANPQSYNRYSYVYNNPLGYTDPTGHIACNHSNLPGEDHFCPEIGSSDSWVDTDDVTMYQDWGNTEFSFGLGADGEATDIPNYSYCNGFHCGIDEFALAGTYVQAGIGGQVVYVSDWTAYSPRYIVIRIGRDVYMRIAHLDTPIKGVDSNGKNIYHPAPVVVGDWVTPNTIVGRVSNYFGKGANHVHIEFFSGGPGKEGYYYNPHQFMTDEFNDLMALNRVNVAGMNFHARSDSLYGSLVTQPSDILNRQQNFNANEPGYTIPHGWIGHVHQE